MRMYRKLVLAGGILLGSMTGLSTASVAHAETKSDPTAVLKAPYGHTKYFCQKYDYEYHCWYTVFWTYSQDDAMAWYDRQGPGTRILEK